MLKCVGLLSGWCAPKQFIRLKHFCKHSKHPIGNCAFKRCFNKVSGNEDMCNGSKITLEIIWNGYMLEKMHYRCISRKSLDAEIYSTFGHLCKRCVFSTFFASIQLGICKGDLLNRLSLFCLRYSFIISLHYWGFWQEGACCCSFTLLVAY